MSHNCWCGRTVYECSMCKGVYGKVCRKCDGTGYMCGTHDGKWQEKTKSWF